MESKRKVNGGAAAAEELDDRASKRRRLPDGNQETPESTSQKGLTLIAQLKKMSERSGRYIADDFLELPPKKELPDYYVFIKMPVALNTIEGKLKRHEFHNLSAVESMFHRMVANAKQYNEEESGIVADANKILKAVTTFMRKENPAYKTPGYSPIPTPIPGEATASQRASEDAASEEDAEGEDDDAESVLTPATKRGARQPKKPSLSQMIANSKRRASQTPKTETTSASSQFAGLTFQQAQDAIVSDMISHKESEDDELFTFEVFHNLPPRSLKEYYAIIQEPVSLKGLQKRVRGIKGRNDPTGVSDFKTWAAFYDEVSLIWKNAWHFNEDGSDIHELAKDLKTYFEALFSKAKAAVPEASSGPKIKLKMTPMAAPEPVPKISLRLGSKASPADVSAVAIDDRAQTPAGETRASLPAAQTTIPIETSQLDRARSASRAAASPSPMTAVKDEEPAKAPVALAAPINGISNGTATLQHTNGVQSNPSSLSNGHVPHTSPYPPNPAPIQAPPDLFKWRAPGKTAADAMITNLQFSTHPGLNIERHVRLDIQPSDKMSQYSQTFQLPSTHYYLQVKPTIAERLLTRQHKLFVTTNNIRSQARPTIPGQPIDNAHPLFEIRLVPGVNRVEVELIAALPKGEKGVNGQDAELEKITVFINLQRQS